MWVGHWHVGVSGGKWNGDNGLREQNGQRFQRHPEWFCGSGALACRRALWATPPPQGRRGGLKRSGVEPPPPPPSPRPIHMAPPPICPISSRACLHTAFIAFSVPCMCDWPLNVPQAYCAAPCPPGFEQGTGASWFRALAPGHASLRSEGINGLVAMSVWGPGRACSAWLSLPTVRIVCIRCIQVH